MSTISSMLRIGAVVALLLSGCSLYSDDDGVEPGPDGAMDAAVDAAAPESRTYRAEWTCSSAECASPLTAADHATILRGAGAARVSWYRNGDPADLAVHTGTEDGTCVDVPRDAEAIERSAYSLCPPDGAPAPVLTAEIAWGDSQWSVTLTPL